MYCFKMYNKIFLIFYYFLCLFICTKTYVIAKPINKLESNCNLPIEIVNDIKGYKNVTNQIINHFIEGPLKGKTWKSLQEFIDKFGNRIAGSQNLENAIDYIVDLSKENNLENVHTENVEIPRWNRGKEYAVMLLPRIKNLRILGLGLSVGTPEKGITAKAIVVKSFDELKNLSSSKVEGKIVVYDQEYITYGETVQYRSKGASEAAKKGAIAALVRSITPFSLNTPHTGMQTYDKNVTKIPVAAITIEDADLLYRYQQSGNEILLHLKMSATLDTAISRNTIVELEGSSFKEKFIIVSGHLDSWDVGDGSLDDGGGAFISWITPIALKNLNLRPKRTIRTILWTAEEEGLIGAIAYEKAHKNKNGNLCFVMESDYGTFKPLGLIYEGSKEGECMVKEILQLFSSINATNIKLEEPGPDIAVWTTQGIPGGGLYNANEKYFWYHHSEGDRLNVMNPDILDQAAAFWSAFSYIVADMKYEIPRK